MEATALGFLNLPRHERVVGLVRCRNGVVRCLDDGDKAFVPLQSQHLKAAPVIWQAFGCAVLCCAAENKGLGGWDVLPSFYWARAFFFSYLFNYKIIRLFDLHMVLPRSTYPRFKQEEEPFSAPTLTARTALLLSPHRIDSASKRSTTESPCRSIFIRHLEHRGKGTDGLEFSRMSDVLAKAGRRAG